MYFEELSDNLNNSSIEEPTTDSFSSLISQSNINHKFVRKLSIISQLKMSGGETFKIENLNCVPFFDGNPNDPFDNQWYFKD